MSGSSTTFTALGALPVSRTSARFARSRRRSPPAPDRWTRRCGACRRRRARWTIGSVKSPVAVAGSFGEDVERDAQAACSRIARAQRVVIDDLGARRVDDEAAGRAAGRARRALTSCRRLRRQRQVDAQDVATRAATSAGDGASETGSATARRRTPSSTASAVVSGAILAVEPPAPEHDVHAEAGGAADHLAGDAAGAEESERRARTARAPSSTPSCSTCPRAGRRRCRESGGRARASGRTPARRRRSRSCRGNSRRGCPCAVAALTSIVFTPAPARTMSLSVGGIIAASVDLRRADDEHARRRVRRRARRRAPASFRSGS